MRDRTKAQDYIIQDLKGETVGRMPGTVNGQQLVIQNCQVSQRLVRLVSDSNTDYLSVCQQLVIQYCQISLRLVRLVSDSNTDYLSVYQQLVLQNCQVSQ